MTQRGKVRLRRFLIFGACAVMLVSGVVSLCSINAAFSKLAYFLGAFGLLAGALMAVSYFLTNRGSGAVFYLLAGITLFALGGLLTVHRFLSAATLPLLFSATLAVLSGTVIRMSVTFKKMGTEKWWAALTAGIVCAVLAAASLLTPIASLFITAVLTGILEVAAAIALFIMALLYEKKKKREGAKKPSAQQKEDCLAAESEESAVSPAAETEEQPEAEGHPACAERTNDRATAEQD